MHSVPHLLNEDRPDFERVLDDALRIVLDDMDDNSGPAPGEVALPLNAEQLRTLALASTEEINGAVSDAYEAYRTIREDAREAAREAAQSRDNRAFGHAAMGVADRAGSGAGLGPVLAVLTPLLAGAAAIIFLLIGYAMRAVSPEPGIASPLRTAGWFFAIVTGASVLLGGIGLLLTALRDGSDAIRDTPDSLPPEVHRARDHWREELLTRGILPFLDDALTSPDGSAQPAPAGSTQPTPAPPGGSPRMPHLGYSHPTFSSPQDPRPATPHFTSPDFTSPDWGGPEHAPE